MLGFNIAILTTVMVPQGIQHINDLGVITLRQPCPLSPTPVESMKFLHYLYDENKSLYVGLPGLMTLFSPQYNWVTPRYLAIDKEQSRQ
jgi:hypothetical protein